MTSSYDDVKLGERTPDKKTVGELVSEVLTRFSQLARTEIALLRAEAADKSKKAIRGGAMLGLAALMAVSSLAIVMLALVAFLVEVGLAASLSCLITALIGFGIAGVLAKVGLNRLRAELLVPNRTISQLQRDAATLKEHL